MTEVTIAPPDTLKGDMLSGVKEISRFLGLPERTVFNMLATGRLPGAFKIGAIWHARRTTILKGIEALERGETAA